MMNHNEMDTCEPPKITVLKNLSELQESTHNQLNKSRRTINNQK